MWRLKQWGTPWRGRLFPARASRYVLRLGQAQFQLWQAVGRHLTLLTHRPAEHIGYNQFQAITDELDALTQTLPMGSGVQLLVDSKWMPLSLLSTGRAPLSSAQIQALAAHRFAQAYGEQAQGWRIQTNYVSGDEQTLAFACAAQLLSSVRQGLGLDAPGSSRQLRLQSMQPTFCWVWNRVRGHETIKDGWIALSEHDRSVMAFITKGRVSALQPAGPILSTPAQLAAALPTQALRCGLIEEGSQQALGISLEPYVDKMQELVVSGARWHAIGIGNGEVPL